MHTKLSTNHRLDRMFVNILSIFAILAIAIPVTSAAYASASSPFVGHWQATDVDGSDIRLTIGGPPNGPFQITWTESYISFCNREAGIVRGTGQLSESDPYLLEADLHLECFTTGETLDFHLVWRYHPATGTLSGRYDNGVVTIWHRPGRPLPPPPGLDLRVNYGHDWVESFYEGGHMAWVTVTESDGVTVKATAELVTEPKDFWGGETGFQTRAEDWVPAQPDILPNDWVFGWVDNGASAQVQIGDISGAIDLAADSVEGTVLAPGISDPVQIECLDWGSGGEPFPNKDGGFILTNGTDPYSCSWAGEWDVQPGQTIGVGYFDPDGNWVANAFSITPLVLYIHYEYPDVVEGSYELGHSVQVTVFDSDGATKATASTTTIEMPHWGGAPGFRVEQWDGLEGPPDLQPGDVVRAVVDDGFLTAEARIGEIAAAIDLAANSITGTIAADWAGDLVNVVCMPWGGPEGTSEQNTMVAPDGSSEFTCTWDSAEWDIQPGETVGVSYYGDDLHWVANGFFIPRPTFVAYIPGAIEGYDWPMGTAVSININNGEYTDEAFSEPRPDFPEGATRVLFELWRNNFSIEAGDHIVMTDGVVTKEVVVTNLAVTDINLGAHTVSGIYDPAYDLWVWLYGQDGQVPATAGDTWVATFAELSPDVWGGAVQHDADGDGTSLDFRTPNPVILGWLEWDVVEGNGWHIGDTVTLTIGDFTRSAVVEPASGDPLYGHVRFELGAEGYDLKVGDFVTMSDGVITKELLVPQLEITDYDLGAHTISGTYDPALSFWIRVNEMEPDNVAFDGNTWVATFSGLGPNMWGDAGQTDNDGDDIRATIHTPNPNLYALPDENKIFAQVWIVGRALELKIYNSNGEEIYSDSQVVEPPSEVPWTVVIFDLGAAGFDLLPGQRIILNQGGYERELVVSSLQITGFDLGSQIISGVGDPGADFLIRIDGQDVWSTVAADGTWSVYHQLLQPGVWGEAIQPDGEDGDETRDGFQAPFE